MRVSPKIVRMRASFLNSAMVVIIMVVCSACASVPTAFDTGNPTPATARVVRVVRSQGGTTERLSTVPLSEIAAPTARATPTMFEPRPPTATATPTPSWTWTVTVTPTQTVTPTSTPLGGANIQGAVIAFRSVERYRAALTGPADIIQEVDGPDKVRIFITGNQSNELIVAYGLVYQRSGGRWFLRSAPPGNLAERLDRFIQPLVDLRRTYTQIGVIRTRAGRCMEWNVESNTATEPMAICIGVADHLPYRLRFPGGLTVEYYDFHQNIIVPEPLGP